MKQDHIQNKSVAQDSRIPIFIYSIQDFHIESDWLYMKNYIDQQPVQNQESCIPGFSY